MRKTKETTNDRSGISGIGMGPFEASDLIIGEIVEMPSRFASRINKTQNT